MTSLPPSVIVVPKTNAPRRLAPTVTIQFYRRNGRRSHARVVKMRPDGVVIVPTCRCASFQAIYTIRGSMTGKVTVLPNQKGESR